MADDRKASESACTPARLRVLKKKLITNSKVFLKLFATWWLFMIVGIFLFIYIEECLRPTPKPLSSLQKTWRQTCQLVMRNNTANSTENVTSIQKNIMYLCEQEKWQFSDDKRCVFDTFNIAKYFDYLCTVAFTVGFGHIVPYSDLGKIATMVFALPAIGLTLALYAYTAEIILIGTQILAAIFEKRVLRRKKVYFCNYKLCVIQIVLAVMLYCLMTGLIMIEEEKLGTLDCFYFTFISLTTIGFGDIYYDSNRLDNGWAFLPTVILFLVAVGTVASTISAVNDVLKKNFAKKRWFSSRKHSKDKSNKINTKL